MWTFFGGETKAQRLATQVFGDDFDACKDKTDKELQEDLNHYISWFALELSEN